MKKHLSKIITEMLTLQDNINSVINPAWREANNPWYRAIWTECAELMDHVGWKWWKNQVVDLQQAQMEIIDIWHFGLSDLLQHAESMEFLVSKIEEYENLMQSKAKGLNINKEELLTLIENFMFRTIQLKKFDIESFLSLSICLELNINEIYKLYVAKNILNKFRQDNGYKSGEYIKIWNNREDNEHLYEILSHYYTKERNVDLSTYLNEKLSYRYKSLVK